jgi:hypothetical protein
MGGMAVAVRVTATVTGHRRRGVVEHELELPLSAGPASARQIIEAAVTAEVAAYEARAEQAGLVRVLTEKSLAEELVTGAVRAGGGDPLRPPAGPVNAAAAIETALLAFEDGLFRVFVGDEEVTGEAPATLADGASVLFLRLVPLAGG